MFLTRHRSPPLSQCGSWLRRLATFFVICLTDSASAIVPEYTVNEGAVHIKGVGPDNPLIYDNDWWFDVFDNNYLWAQASLGEVELSGNIVTRDMWDWQKGYHYEMDACVGDAQKALKLARDSGLREIPDLTLGSDRVLVRPDSGRIEDTKAHPTDGSRLIVAEAKKASAEKPLVVIVGGPLTTVANALLTAPEIAPNLVVFGLTVSSNGYNGKDAWSAYIVARRTRLVDWATGTFWDKNSVFTAKHFEALPANPFCDDMRRLIKSNLGQANQLGDGAPLVWLWRNDCWKGARPRKAVWRGKTVRFEAVESAKAGDVLDIPKASTDLDASREEFFRVLSRPELFERTERRDEPRESATLEIPPTTPAGPPWSRNLPVYEINPRQFTRKGTFKAIERHLPRLKQLGVGILWFMPIHPSGEKRSFGSFYCVKEFRDVNPDYGTKRDFKNLVDAIHDQGLYAFMDWVPHHSSFDNPLTEQHPDWYRRNDKGEILHARGWRDVAWFDFSKRGLWEYHRDTLIYWINDFGIDGFRCDVAWGVPIEFWNWLRPELDANATRKIFMAAVHTM